MADDEPDLEDVDLPSLSAGFSTIFVVLLVFGGIVGMLSYVQVAEGHTGVHKSWGAVTGNTLDPGAHFVVPIQDSVQRVETRPRTYTMSNTQREGEKSRADAITVKTVNGSSVDVDVTIRYRIKTDEADAFVEEWNNEQQMERRLIRPTVRSDLRDEASDLQTTGENGIYTRFGRERLAETAREALDEAFEDEPIELEAVQVRNIDLPESIDQTLDEKEEEKQQVQVELEKVKQERAKAEQKRVAAQADADVIAIKGQALQSNPIVLQERYIEALEDGSVFVVGGGETPVILDTNMSAPGNTTGTTSTTVPPTGNASAGG